jgi:FAD/FMN-containing dehydrogenase
MRLAEDLRSCVAGDVFGPGDDGYGPATQTWDLAAVSRPPLVLVAATDQDIAAGARWADRNELGIAILNTGHGAFSPNDGVLVINTGRVNTVQVDIAGRWATVGAGARWSDVSAAAGPHGLIGAAGGSPGVGVIGYTLGGGLSPLGRTLGFAADRVTSLTVLDADYRPLRVGADDGETFWALRGGGPLGIVTGMEFELASIPSFYGGGIYFDGAHAPDLLSAYADWVADLDDRTSTSIALIHLPPAPQLPPELRGRFVVHLRVAHVGPGADDLAAEGRRACARMLAAAPAIIDATRVMTPDEVPDIHRDPVAPQDVAYRGGFVDDLDAATIATIAGSIPPAPSAGPRMIELRHLGGAYSRSPIAPSSSTGRGAPFNLYVTAASTPEVASDARTLVDRTVQAITPSHQGQLNFYGPSPSPGSILDLWDDTDAGRLLAVAQELDPRGRIHTGRPLR